MKLNKIVPAFALFALCCTGAANATTIKVLTNTSSGAPVLGLDDVGLFSGLFPTGPLTSAEKYFQVGAGVSGADAGVVATPLTLQIGSTSVDLFPAASNVSLELYKGATLLAGGIGVTQFIYSGLTTGTDYHLKIFGNSGYFEGQITTSPVPLPAAAWLLLSGLAGVGAFARRRRSKDTAEVAA